MKKYIDIALSACLLVFFFPVMFIAWLAVKLTSRGPGIIVQTRVGKDGKTFSFYKLRSMYEHEEEEAGRLLERNESVDGVIFKMKNDPRVTPVGRFIRKYSIDELPQLVNVLKGDMSLVGPRPPFPSEVSQYTEEERRRLDVLPGLTCLWQISGRSDLPFSEQVRLDMEYIQNQSLANDFKILLKTIPAVISGRGAY